MHFTVVNRPVASSSSLSSQAWEREAKLGFVSSQNGVHLPGHWHPVGVENKEIGLLQNGAVMPPVLPHVCVHGALGYRMLEADAGMTCECQHSGCLF